MILNRKIHHIAVIFAALLVAAPFPRLQAGLWDMVKSAFVKAEKPKPPVIKVLIAHDIDAAQIEVKGRHVIFDPHTKDRLTTHFSGKKGTIVAIPTGIKWGEEFPKRYQIQIIPESKGGTILVDGVEYRGSITIYAIDLERISIVNNVDIEDYVHSVLAPAIDKPYSDEALAALAIATRTQAYYQSMGSQNSFWHVAAHRVGYRGANVEYSVPNMKNAISATRYMVMSQTGTYEGVITPFPVQVVHGDSTHKGKIVGFSIEEAETFAKRGDNASKILHQVFPQATIELAHNPGQHRTEEIAEAPKKKETTSLTDNS